MTPAEKTALVKNLAQTLGFDRVGVVRLAPNPRTRYYKQWLARGHAGSMRYLGRNVPLRENPSRLLPGSRTAICVALSCYRPDPPSPAPDAIPAGRIATYARGADYHLIIRQMLQQLMTDVSEQIGESFEHRVFVDTGPIVERELASAAGIGWIGKSTMLLHERLGSHLLLGEAITALELAADAPAVNRCGNCTRCLDACPTGALRTPYELDASRCISYFTIEHRGEVPAEFHEQIGDWVFGCDICQRVCPFNKHAPPATRAEISADRITPYLPLRRLLCLRSGEYRRLIGGTAAGRSRRNMWRRNAAIALGNARTIGDEERQALDEACDDEDPGLRHAAREAVKRLRPT